MTDLAFSADCSGVIVTPGFRLPSVAPPPHPEKLRVETTDNAKRPNLLNLRIGKLLMIGLGTDFVELLTSFEVVRECKVNRDSFWVKTQFVLIAHFSWPSTL